MGFGRDAVPRVTAWAFVADVQQRVPTAEFSLRGDPHGART